MDFQGFVREIELNSWCVYGIEVYQDGKLIENYGDTIKSRYPIYSATKTITSIAVGMAVGDGRLGLDDFLLNYIPEDAKRKLLEEQLKPYSVIRIRDLLAMSVQGFPFRPEGDSWLDYALACPVTLESNGKVHYSNISAYLVGVATSVAVGENLYDYLERRLFQPLGIKKPPYGKCPEGYFYGASHMELTVNELSRIGLLLYNRGLYQGKRIVSEAYIDEATSFDKCSKTEIKAYGYLIWKYRDGFSINGKWGQRCLVLPNQGLIITYLSHMVDNDQQLLAAVEKYLL